VKKIIALFFLSVFLFNSLGYFIAFKFSQLEIKTEMRAEIMAATPDSRLICVTIPSEEVKNISWTEQHEFSYKGNMYDVVRAEKKTDGSTSFFCMNDSKEEELLSKLDESLSAQLDVNKMANGKTAKLMLKLLAFDYCAEPAHHASFLSEKDYLTFSFVPACLSPSQEISSPPPRLV
jgi:hypothetical protein